MALGTSTPASARPAGKSPPALLQSAPARGGGRAGAAGHGGPRLRRPGGDPALRRGPRAGERRRGGPGAAPPGRGRGRGSPPGPVLSAKPAAVIGATAGRWGTRLAQAAVRQVLYATDSLVLPAPALFVAGAELLFDDEGRLAGPTTRN